LWTCANDLPTLPRSRALSATLPGSPQNQPHQRSCLPLRIGSPSLSLLGELPGLEVVDLNAGCCGMAGTFGMKTDNYDLSLSVGEPLFQRVVQVAPDIIVSECSTCRMQLAHATGLPVIHPIRLLAEAYGV
jgi:glycerol-3-phosphate dehydrogenase subunit C